MCATSASLSAAPPISPSWICRVAARCFPMEAAESGAGFRKIGGVRILSAIQCHLLYGLELFSLVEAFEREKYREFRTSAAYFSQSSATFKDIYLKWGEMMGMGAMGSARRVRRCMGMSERRLDDAVACWCDGLTMRRLASRFDIGFSACGDALRGDYFFGATAVPAAPIKCGKDARGAKAQPMRYVSC